jgi:alpha-L-fucosidase 2
MWGDGTSGVYYTVENVTYEREAFTSEPAGVIAMMIVSDTPGAVSFHLHLDRGGTDGTLNRWEHYSRKVGNNIVMIGGASGGDAPIGFAAGARIVSNDGSVSTLGDYVFCKNATEAWIYFAAWTSFRVQDPATADLNQLQNLGNQSYTNIRAADVADYQSFFNRTSLNLGTSTPAQRNQATAQRLSALGTGPFDSEIATLYFQFSRYLLISTSRPAPYPQTFKGSGTQTLIPNGVQIHNQHQRRNELLARSSHKPRRPHIPSLRLDLKYARHWLRCSERDV